MLWLSEKRLTCAQRLTQFPMLCRTDLDPSVISIRFT